MCENLRAWQERYDYISVLMEEVLGPAHDVVMHSIISYSAGGPLDLYYYPHGISGTGIATKELGEDPDQCSTNDVFESYELVMFTRQALHLDVATTTTTPFGAVHSKISAILNAMARYSADATLNPHQTCEFPGDIDRLGGACLIFDAYGIDDLETRRDFGLLLLIEVFRSEMNFARRNGVPALLERLKLAGHYPYSDLDRDPVA